MGDDSGNRRQQLVDAISRVDPAASPDLYTFAGQLRHAREAFHNWTAATLETPLNTYLASLPQGTIEEKRAVAKEAVAIMRMLGVAIQTPTGEPGCLAVNKGDDPRAGQFAVYIPDRGHRYIQRSVSLMPLKLVGQADRHVKHETLTPWLERVGSTHGASPLRPSASSTEQLPSSLPPH